MIDHYNRKLWEKNILASFYQFILCHKHGPLPSPTKYTQSMTFDGDCSLLKHFYASAILSEINIGVAQKWVTT